MCYKLLERDHMCMDDKCSVLPIGKATQATQLQFWL